MTFAKADQEYWNDLWVKETLPRAVNPASNSLRDHSRSSFHRYFSFHLPRVFSTPVRFLEIGCGRSIWLPYFGSVHSYSVAGIDYSPRGCQQVEALLKRQSVKGDIYCADFFTGPEVLNNKFDVVFSNGVAEHFIPTSDCIRAMAKFLRPGGLLVTVVPNMAGSIGILQKALNKPVYDIHVVITPEDLRYAHESSGMTVLSSHYFLSSHFGVCNLNGIPPSTPEWFLKTSLLKLLSTSSVALWVAERFWGRLRPSKLLSPYIISIAKRPLDLDPRRLIPSKTIQHKHQ